MTLTKHIPILEISNLKIERGVAILKKINWRVDPGQHWVILGANGSGKTCLLNALTGYLTPTEGEISLLGECYGRSDWRELRKHVGVVSPAVRQMIDETEYAIETVVSGKNGMINYWGRVQTSDRHRAMNILRQIECEHIARRPWVCLSQGERQRILIGRALMTDPVLLILDEPCAGLDPIARGNFLSFLQRIGRKKTSPALVLVTHHVEEIVPAFSHVLLLKKGEVIMSGKKKESLTSHTLSKTFDYPIRLQQKNGRYSMVVNKLGKKIF